LGAEPETKIADRRLVGITNMRQRSMPTLLFRMTASPTSNDHQVRIVVDGTDLVTEFGNESLGIDPPVFFRQPALHANGSLALARCGCGVPLCGDTTAVAIHNSDTIVWLGLPKTRFGDSITFDRLQFMDAVRVANADLSWETPERTAERLIAALDMTAPQEAGLTFQWASGRIYSDKITVCYTIQGANAPEHAFDCDYQVLSHLPWDHTDSQAAVRGVKNQVSLAPNNWPDVEYIPQRGIVTTPNVAGPGWRRK
jgi:hypothetical protein